MAVLVLNGTTVDAPDVTQQSHEKRQYRTIFAFPRQVLFVKALDNALHGTFHDVRQHLFHGIRFLSVRAEDRVEVLLNCRLQDSLVNERVVLPVEDPYEVGFISEAPEVHLWKIVMAAGELHWNRVVSLQGLPSQFGKNAKYV